VKINALENKSIHSIFERIPIEPVSKYFFTVLIFTILWHQRKKAKIKIQQNLVNLNTEHRNEFYSGMLF